MTDNVEYAIRYYMNVDGAPHITVQPMSLLAARGMLARSVAEPPKTVYGIEIVRRTVSEWEPVL